MSGGNGTEERRFTVSRLEYECMDGERKLLDAGAEFTTRKIGGGALVWQKAWAGWTPLEGCRFLGL